MRDEELADQLISLLLGYETMAVELAWVFYWLQAKGSVLETRQSELETE